MASLNEAFDFQDVPSYISPDEYPLPKPIFGYICAKCDGCYNYHKAIQKRNPHNFVKGVYRKLLPCERGPFYSDGTSLLN